MDVMTKLLVISPHWSTGGSCSVTINKIELLKDECEIKVVEYSFLSSHFVVHRNKVIELVGNDNFHSLHDNKTAMLKGIIEDFKPDVIAMEEFPEMFMDRECSDWLYSYDNKPYIIETTHDSSFNPHNKRYFPNEFVFVSAYNALKYSHLDIKTSIIEYPVTTYGYEHSLPPIYGDKVGFDPNYKNIVIVGLFTPRKNQKYAFYLAERLLDYNVKFHFLGNQAENFADYWKPLMDRKPENCVVWGEKDNIDDYIKASDLFLFPSKGDRGNKELNPIVIKEAQKYDNLPKLLFNLDVYLNKYNNARNFHFLTGDLHTDADKIVELTKCEKITIDKSKELVIIGTYPNTEKREQLTIDCIKSLQKLDRKLMLVSHYPVSIEIQNMVDFYVFDKENPLTHHSYYTHFYSETDQYYAQVNINGLKNTNQSLTVLTNLYNGFKTAKNYGFEKAFYLTYDVIVNRKDLAAIETSFKEINNDTKAYLATLNTPFGKGVQTNGMTFDVDFFLKTFHDVRNEEAYNAICKDLKCENFLEDYLIKSLSNLHENSVKFMHFKEETFLKNSGLGESSNSEYYSILPIENEPNSFMFYFYTYNRDNRSIIITFSGDKLESHWIQKLKDQHEFKKQIDFKGNDIKISIEFAENEKIIKREEYLITQNNIAEYNKNGIFRKKDRPKYKIKLVHLQTNINDEREQKSFKSLRQVGDYGWEYVLHTNRLYKDLPPIHNCQRPDCVSLDLFDEHTVQHRGTALTPAHYGCYEAFKNAILSEFDEDIDFLIVCEGDCKLELPVEEFIREVESICLHITHNNVGYMSFGDRKTLEHGWDQSPVIEDIHDRYYITNHIIGLQCVMFPNKVRTWLKNKLRTELWDAADMYFNSIFFSSPYKMGVVKKRLTTQYDGFSLIDKTDKKFL